MPMAASVDAPLSRAWRIRSSEPRRAIDLAGTILVRARRRGDRRAIAQCLSTIAAAKVAVSSYDEAIATAHEALSIFRDDGDVAGEALALATLASAQRRLGDLASAREILAVALERAQRGGTPEIIAICLNGFGSIHRSTGEYDLSLELQRRARDLAHSVGSEEEECGAMLGIGSSLERLGRYSEALETYREALAIAERLGHTRMEAYAAGNIGTTLERLGFVSEALAYELRSLAMKQLADDRWGLGVSYNNLGLIYRYLGEYASALEANVKSLETTRAIGDREGESVALNGIGQVYEDLGDMTRVLECYSASLEISRTIGFRQGEAFSLAHLGRFYQHVGDVPRALMCHLRCLRIAETSGERYLQSAALISVGHAYAALGEIDNAERSMRGAYDLAHDTGDRLGEASSLLALGELLSGSATDTARVDEGIEHLMASLAIAEELGHTESMRSVLLRLADVHARRGDRDGAQRFSARYRMCTEEIFNVETTRRVSELLVGFEGSALREQALAIGLEETDLAELDAAVRRGIQTRMAASRPASDDATAVIDRAGRADADPTGIVVRTFGEFRVSVGGRELGTAEWKRKRARDLFKLLLINHRRALTLDEIIETLWDGRADRKSEMLVMNAISHIRSALEPDRRRGASSAYLVGSDRSYALHLDESAWVDFLRFKEIVVAARRTTNARERRDLYEQAADLYRGDFLKEEYYEPWTATERDLLKDAFLESVEFLAVEYARSGEHDAAIDAARRIIASDCTSERAHEVLIASLVARGRHADARRALEECSAAYARELDEEPPARFATLLDAR
jgi:tetratricopeptide (TPR) repeat protein